MHLLARHQIPEANKDISAMQGVLSASAKQYLFREIKMRRPIILGGNPYIMDYHRKTAKELFDETGGNSGNLAFRFGVANQLVNPKFLSFSTPTTEIKKQGDIIILPLANQLGKHTDLAHAADRLAEINLPVIGVGLGAQTDSKDSDVVLTAGTTKWLETIAKLAPSASANIGTRGEYTKYQISRFGFESSAIVTGCPSNFINFNTDIIAQLAKGFRSRPRNVAVTAGIPFIPSLSKLEQDLADMVSVTGGAYIVQHGLQMLQIARNEFDLIPADILELCRNYIAPSKKMDEFITWCRQYAYAFYDVRAWMDFVKRFDFVVGTRFHGAMLAIQAGVPAACIAHDSRTQEMCETMGIPVCHYKDIQGGLTLGNVFDYFSFDEEKFRACRQQLCRSYISIFDAADVEITKGLRGLAI
ncbi:polysaccharide pyruvyl transferase family protein [Paeniroseomonas aquatica]|uniref:Polysaccharide pyruvyl transferase family protein n=1 Tax=Paeniroseomonas aquatica TaxID=373043 RepID=A0ABT8A009_9PROT|nr:polysaccharide pyruvyl transferase family protein [Paeniroseomonas aquatica]MDN3563063.1 polysaccharide pyruvyl transferase family protein [Paeniroseomonas aquatica]